MIPEVGERYVQLARGVTRGCLIILGASVPISIALDNVLVVLILATWLFTSRFQETYEAIRANPVALMAMLWVIAHLVGALYATAETSDVARSVRKAAPFLLVPIAITAIHRDGDRQLAFYAFMAAIALTAILASLRYASWVPADAPFLKAPGNTVWVVFKYHITQSVFLAYGAFIFAVQAGRARHPAMRGAFWACAGLALINVLFLGDGRTGQIAMFALIVYYGAWRAGARGAVIACAATLALAALAYATPGSGLSKRAALVTSEAAEWEAGGGASTSTGRRLDYYTNSVKLFLAKPVIGVGTGGFPAAYEQQVRGTTMQPTRNPHNEYLLKLVELGAIGGALLILLLAVPWRCAAQLASKTDIALARGLVLTFAVASAVTSTFSDHAEGLLFVWAAGVLFSGYQPRAHV